MPVDHGKRGSVLDRVNNFQVQIDAAKEERDPEKQDIHHEVGAKVQTTIDDLRRASSRPVEAPDSMKTTVDYNQDGLVRKRRSSIQEKQAELTDTGSVKTVVDYDQNGLVRNRVSSIESSEELKRRQSRSEDDGLVARLLNRESNDNDPRDSVHVVKQENEPDEIAENLITVSKSVAEKSVDCDRAKPLSSSGENGGGVKQCQNIIKKDKEVQAPKIRARRTSKDFTEEDAMKFRATADLERTEDNPRVPAPKIRERRTSKDFTEEHAEKLGVSKDFTEDDVKKLAEKEARIKRRRTSDGSNSRNSTQSRDISEQELKEIMEQQELKEIIEQHEERSNQIGLTDMLSTILLPLGVAGLGIFIGCKYSGLI